VILIIISIIGKMFVLVSVSYLSLKSKLLNRWLCVHHIAGNSSPWISRRFSRRLLSHVSCSVAHWLSNSQLVIVVAAKHDCVFKDAAWRSSTPFLLNIDAVWSDTLASCWHVSHNVHWLFSSEASVGISAVNLRGMDIGLRVLMRLVAWSRWRRILLIALQTLIVNCLPESQVVMGKDSVIASFLFMAAHFSVFNWCHRDFSCHWPTLMSWNIFVIIGFVLIIYILIVNLVFMRKKLIILFLVGFCLIVTIDYLRNTNSIVVVFFLQLLLFELLNNCCLLSSFWHASAISNTEVCDTEVLLLVAGHQICNTI
jgi:hypothetical protein